MQEMKTRRKEKGKKKKTETHLFNLGESFKERLHLGQFISLHTGFRVARARTLLLKRLSLMPSVLLAQRRVIMSKRDDG